MVHDCDDEPDPGNDWNRLSELQRRNTLCLPHQKSSYPVEVQTRVPMDMSEMDLQRGMGNNYGGGAGLPSTMMGDRTVDRMFTRTQKRKSMEMEQPPTKVIQGFFSLLMFDIQCYTALNQ